MKKTVQTYIQNIILIFFVFTAPVSLFAIDTNKYLAIEERRGQLTNIDDLPMGVQDLLKEPNYSYLSFVSYEKIYDTTTKKMIHHKMMLVGDQTMHLLFFDLQGQLIEEHEWVKSRKAVSMGH